MALGEARHPARPQHPSRGSSRCRGNTRRRSSSGYRRRRGTSAAARAAHDRHRCQGVRVLGRRGDSIEQLRQPSQGCGYADAVLVGRLSTEQSDEQSTKQTHDLFALLDHLPVSGAVDAEPDNAAEDNRNTSFRSRKITGGAATSGGRGDTLITGCGSPWPGTSCRGPPRPHWLRGHDGFVVMCGRIRGISPVGASDAVPTRNRTPRPGPHCARGRGSLNTETSATRPESVSGTNAAAHSAIPETNAHSRHTTNPPARARIQAGETQSWHPRVRNTPPRPGATANPAPTAPTPGPSAQLREHRQRRHPPARRQPEPGKITTADIPVILPRSLPHTGV